MSSPIFLPPPPGQNLLTKKDAITAPWLYWFQILRQYILANTGALEFASVSITSAQLLAMTNAGGGIVTLVPSPGRRRLLRLVAAAVEYDPGTVAYSLTANPVFKIFTGLTKLHPWIAGLAAQADLTMNTLASHYTAVDTLKVSGTTIGFRGQPLTFQLDSGGPLTAGNGSLKVGVVYVVTNS